MARREGLRRRVDWEVWTTCVTCAAGRAKDGETVVGSVRAGDA
jgi:hypothetical protein